MSLYENLCAACEKRGISLTRLIVESGFASSNIARLKTGSMPSYEMVEAMARRLNMSIDELVYGEKNLVVLNEQERERISAYGRGNVFILDDEEKELLSIYRSKAFHVQRFFENPSRARRAGRCTGRKQRINI